MAKGKVDFMRWLDEETHRRGRDKEVAALFNEMMVEQQLADLRRSRRISQARLAKLMGVKQPLIARIESGRVKNLTLATIARTAATLGATVEFRIKPTRIVMHSRKRSQRTSM